MVLIKNGEIYTFGRNAQGQLGNGNNVNSNIPIAVNGLCQFSSAINEITEPLSVSVFPNPSSGIFSVNLKNETSETKICIYDILGNCVLNKQPNKNNNREIPSHFLIQ